MRLSIASKVSGGNKPYLCHVPTDGYEMGVGRAGVYDPHAHRGFTDIAFAPGGLLIHQDPTPMSGTLHITAPGAWFGPIEFLSDFWFLKFFQSSKDSCSVPDKMTDSSEALYRGCLVATGIEATLPFWHPTEGSRTVTLRVAREELTVTGLESISANLTVTA